MKNTMNPQVLKSKSRQQFGKFDDVNHNTKEILTGGRNLFEMLQDVGMVYFDWNIKQFVTDHVSETSRHIYLYIH